MNPRLPRGVRLREDKIRHRWVLLAPERIFEVDEIGVEILKRCDGRGLEEMLGELAAKFGAGAEDIRADVVGFLTGFAEKKVVEL
jgi:pyrroloquinoline quinone biosynthesis protein D